MIARENVLKARQEIQGKPARTRDEVLEVRLERQASDRHRKRYQEACRYARKTGKPLPEWTDFDGGQDEDEIQKRIRLFKEGRL
jgi:hypothetical protein